TDFDLGRSYSSEHEDSTTTRDAFHTPQHAIPALAVAVAWLLRNSSGRGSPSYRASAGWKIACFIRARCSSTASFSGVPGAAVVGDGGSGALPLKLPTPRRAYLLVDGYCSFTPGV